MGKMNRSNRLRDTSSQGLLIRAGGSPMPSQPEGMGALVSAEGRVTEVGFNGCGDAVQKEVVQCSCRGDNANCFKCDGTGYYERELHFRDGAPLDTRAALAGSAHTLPSREVGFSNDARGDGHGVRERGRFASAPLTSEDDD